MDYFDPQHSFGSRPNLTAQQVADGATYVGHSDEEFDGALLAIAIIVPVFFIICAAAFYTGKPRRALAPPRGRN